MVMRFTEAGRLVSAMHSLGSGAPEAYVIPSPFFDLAVGASGTLWVVNPGKHYLEAYDQSGAFVRKWGETSFETPGFSGCCNPIHIAIQTDGTFVTAEKGIVRVKLYDAKGVFRSVVAPASDFAVNASIADMAARDDGAVIILESTTRRLMFFYPLKK